MQKYKLLMNGKNFLIESESKLDKFGFFQTIHVEANDPEDAELKAVEIIKQSDLRGLVRNEPGDSPMIYLDEIDEIDSFDGIESPNQGRSFYSENTDGE